MALLLSGKLLKFKNKKSRNCGSFYDCQQALFRTKERIKAFVVKDAGSQCLIDLIRVQGS
jgi:hypothetical protein